MPAKPLISCYLNPTGVLITGPISLIDNRLKSRDKN